MAATNSISRLVNKYANAVGRYGPDSKESLRIRAAHADNAVFLGWAEEVDRINRNLGGSGIDYRPIDKENLDDARST